jgi:hypothetical protein
MDLGKKAASSRRTPRRLRRRQAPQPGSHTGSEGTEHVAHPSLDAGGELGNQPSPLGSPISGPRWGLSDPRNREGCPAVPMYFIGKRDR